MTAFDVLSGVIPVFVAAGLVVLVLQALSAGKDRARAAKTAIGCGLMVLVALVVILGASGGGGGGGGQPDDPDVPAADYALANGFLTLNGDVPSYSGNAPWRDSGAGLIVVTDEVGSIGKGAFSDMSSDVLFEGVPRIAGGAFSHPFASDPVEGGYYMVQGGYYVLVPEVPEDMYVYTVTSGKATLTGISDSWERPEYFVMKVPAENYNRYPVISTISRTSMSISPFLGARAVFSESIETVGSYAFVQCSSLAAASFPVADVVKSNAFQYCSGLAAASFPAATTLEGYSFSYCSALPAVSFPDVTSLGTYVFQNCTALKDVSLPEATTFGTYVFTSCTSLKEVAFPAVTTVGSNVFMYCTALKSASLPRATSVSNTMFSNCVSLESVEMPSATTIGSTAFQYCSKMTSFDLSAVTSVSSNAFRYAWGVQEVVFSPDLASVSSSNNPFSSWTFYDSTGTTTLAKTAEALAGKTFQGTYAALIEVPEGEQSLSPEMLRKVADLTEAAEEARKSLASPDDDEHLPGGDPEEEP